MGLQGTLQPMTLAVSSRVLPDGVGRVGGWGYRSVGVTRNSVYKPKERLHWWSPPNMTKAPRSLDLPCLSTRYIQLCGIDPGVHDRRPVGYERFVENAADVAIR